MSANWKYATLTADERINKIRGGDEDVYKSEIQRSMDVIKDREEAGLDISEQKNWIDKISYNHNLANAERMGIASSDVNREGYADRMLGTYQPAKKSTNKPLSAGLSRTQQAENEANALLSEYYNKVKKASEGINHVKEWLINNGIDENSEDGQNYIASFNIKLNDEIQKYKNDYTSKVKKLFANL